jgi:hypothetical protein
MNEQSCQQCKWWFACTDAKAWGKCIEWIIETRAADGCKNYSPRNAEAEQ